MRPQVPSDALVYTISRRAAMVLLGIGVTFPSMAQSVIHVSTLLEQDPATTIAERVLRVAYDRLGMTLEVHHMPGERSLVSANAGDTDGELYRRDGISRTYPNLLRVPVELMHYEIVAFSKNHQFTVNGWESLRPYRLGYVRGIKVIEENAANMTGQPVNTMARAFGMMDLGRIDIVLSNRISGLAALRALKMAGVRVLTPPLASFPVYHYVHRRYADLVPRLESVLRDIQRENIILGIQNDVLSSFGPLSDRDR